MGVAPTGDIFRGFVFDNENSKDFGVYITGEAVYNAPERDMEMISIPGRNGSFALDNGRWENIEVTYSAGIAGDSQTNFAEAISDLRNMLVSKTTYCRLTDDYNPGEYRMALYKSGLDVTPELARGGTFDIVFECKPQRFLTDGDTPITVASGDTLTNPTRFDASPLLAVTGHGDISIGTDGIQVLDSPVGWLYDVPITRQSSWGTDYPMGTTIPLCTVHNPTAVANPTDTIKLTWSHFRLWIDPPINPNFKTYTMQTAAVGMGDLAGFLPPKGSTPGYVSIDDLTLEVPMDASQGVGGSIEIQFLATTGSSTSGGLLTFDVTLTWNADSNQFEFRCDFDTLPSDFGTVSRVWTSNYMQVDIDSTKSTVGTLYIDTEIGEAYTQAGGETVSVNNLVKMGDTLPALKPGDTTVTYDNTVTSLQMTPRWWKL